MVMRPQIADLEPTEELSTAGFRFGDKGTHSSRTIMLSELSDLLATEPADGGSSSDGLVCRTEL